MSALLSLSKVTVLFRRDLVIARSYRSAFVLELFEALFGVAAFYYLSRFVQSAELTRALPQGGSYFAFALVGFAFFEYMGVALNAFDHSIQEARQNGTLETLLVTQTSLPVILAGSAVYPFALMSLRTAVYLAWGIFLFDFPARQANWPGAALVLLVSVLAFAGRPVAVFHHPAAARLCGLLLGAAPHQGHRHPHTLLGAIVAFFAKGYCLSRPCSPPSEARLFRP